MSIKKKNAEKQWLFFYILLQQNGKVSELSGEDLYGNISSFWFHHILPKSKYPKLRFCPENIIIVSADEHAEIEAGKLFDEVEKRKRNIMENYEELVKDTETYELEYLNKIYEHAKRNTTFFS